MSRWQTCLFLEEGRESVVVVEEKIVMAISDRLEERRNVKTKNEISAVFLNNTDNQS